MTNAIIARAEEIIRDALANRTTWRQRARQFLARTPGRPRKASRSEIAALTARGWTAVQIATELGCHPCNVWRALREIE
jgi:DNA-binding NarL/FixJ family response regulator